MNEKSDIKKRSLVAAIRKAGYEIGKSYYECNTEDCYDEDEDDEYNKPRLKDGKIDPNWLEEGFCDQVSEFLYGDNQADDIQIDSVLFAEEVNKKTWDILDEYLDEESVEDYLWEGWHHFLHDTYGELWPLTPEEQEWKMEG